MICLGLGPTSHVLLRHPRHYASEIFLFLRGFYWRVLSNPEARRPLKRIARKFNQLPVTLTSRKGTGGIRNDSRVNLEGSTNLKKANWDGFRKHLFVEQVEGYVNSPRNIACSALDHERNVRTLCAERLARWKRTECGFEDRSGHTAYKTFKASGLQHTAECILLTRLYARPAHYAFDHGDPQPSELVVPGSASFQLRKGVPICGKVMFHPDH